MFVLLLYGTTIRLQIQEQFSALSPVLSWSITTDLQQDDCGFDHQQRQGFPNYVNLHPVSAMLPLGATFSRFHQSCTAVAWPKWRRQRLRTDPYLAYEISLYKSIMTIKRSFTSQVCSQANLISRHKTGLD